MKYLLYLRFFLFYYLNTLNFCNNYYVIISQIVPPMALVNVIPPLFHVSSSLLLFYFSIIIEAVKNVKLEHKTLIYSAYIVDELFDNISPIIIIIIII